MRINTNMAALNAWRNMSANNANLQKSLEKLSSGFRINRAADDAAGLAVSEKMRAQIRGTNMAIRNSQDGVSLLQTAEGALTETHSMLQRMRELSVQSSTSTLKDSDRSLLQEEFSQLQNEITRIGNDTKFNGQNLLDGSAGASVKAAAAGNATNLSATGSTQAGSYVYSAAVKATTGTVYMGNVGTSATAGAAWSATTDAFLNAQTITVNGKSYSVATTTTLQTFLDSVNADSATTGVSAKLTGANVEFDTTSVGSARKADVTSSLTVADYGLGATTGAVAASTTATLVDAGSDATLTLSTGLTGSTYAAEGNNIKIMSGNGQGLSFTVGTTSGETLTVGTNGSLSVQTGAEAGQTLSISIGDMRATTLGASTLNIGTQSGAQGSITALDTAINTVSTQRAKLGALQNRLEYTVSSLSSTAENLSAAESRIRDVDMASEMANFTKYQILQQASTAMLAQANQSTQGILSLLR